MNLKKYVFITFLSFIPLLIYSQSSEDSELTLLEAPENWRGELLTFPLSFAPSLDYKGIEEIRFAEGWANKNSNEFWTYAFVWHLENDPQLTEMKLQKDMEIYFDGLMEVVAKSKELKPEEIKKTLAIFLKKTESNGSSGFIGKIKVYDAFFSQDQITLNVKVHVMYCQKTNTHLALFYASPHEFENDIWTKLKEVRINLSCEN